MGVAAGLHERGDLADAQRVCGTAMRLLETLRGKSRAPLSDALRALDDKDASDLQALHDAIKREHQARKDAEARRKKEAKREAKEHQAREQPEASSLEPATPATSDAPPPPPPPAGTGSPAPSPSASQRKKGLKKERKKESAARKKAGGPIGGAQRAEAAAAAEAARVSALNQEAEIQAERDLQDALRDSMIDEVLRERRKAQASAQEGVLGAAAAGVLPRPASSQSPGRSEDRNGVADLRSSQEIVRRQGAELERLRARLAVAEAAAMMPTEQTLATLEGSDLPGPATDSDTDSFVAPSEAPTALTTATNVRNECSICLIKVPNAACQPCGCVRCCGVCLAKHRKKTGRARLQCPWCRADMTHFVKVNLEA